MDYKFIVSPENIKRDIVSVDYKGQQVGVYSGMTQILTGGKNGTSLLTGLTLNILLTQTATDCGYFTPFDGAILQKDVVANFIFSSTTQSPYTFYVFNTSSEFQKFLSLSDYFIDWGDGSQKQTINTFTPNFISHTYPSADKSYNITLEQRNPWGITKVTKTVTTPYKDVVRNNPKGKAYFIPAGGSWINTPLSYDYIFSGDSVNDVPNQTSNNYVQTPFIVSGFSKSRINELALYGSPKFQVGVPVIKNEQIWGAITNISAISTAYTINNINYYDFIDGRTIYFQQSNGLSQNNITAEPITKLEALLKVYDQPQVQSDVYIERGKSSAYERVQRLGEVDNLGDMINYGYGFFNVENVLQNIY